MGLAERFMGFLGMPEDYHEEKKSQEDAVAGDTFGDSAPQARETASRVQAALVAPREMDEALTIAEHLNANRIVVLNLEYASRETARRLLDFLGGAAYAKGGELSRIANSTYLITPYDVDFMEENEMPPLGATSYF